MPLSDVLTALSDYSLTLECGYCAGNLGTPCLPAIPTPGLCFFCLNLDFSVVVLVQVVIFWLSVFSLLVPAPDAFFISSRRHPGSRRHIHRLQTPSRLQTPPRLQTPTRLQTPYIHVLVPTPHFVSGSWAISPPYRPSTLGQFSFV